MARQTTAYLQTPASSALTACWTAPPMFTVSTWTCQLRSGSFSIAIMQLTDTMVTPSTTACPVAGSSGYVASPSMSDMASPESSTAPLTASSACAARGISAERVTRQPELRQRDVVVQGLEDHLHPTPHLRLRVRSLQQIARQQCSGRVVELHDDARVGNCRGKSPVTGVVHDRVGVNGALATDGFEREVDRHAVHAGRVRRMLEVPARLAALQRQHAPAGRFPEGFRPLVRDRNWPGHPAPVAHRHGLVPSDPARLPNTRARMLAPRQRHHSRSGYDGFALRPTSVCHRLNLLRGGKLVLDAQEPAAGSIPVDEQPQPNQSNRDGDEDPCPAHIVISAASAVPVEGADAGEADVPTSAPLEPWQSCRATAGSLNDLVRPDQQRLLDRQSYSPGSTRVNRYETLALRFQSPSSVTFESCLHSVARTSQARLVAPPEPFDATCRERAFRVLLQLPARDQVLTSFVYVQNDRQHRRPSVHFILLVSLVLSRGVVWAVWERYNMSQPWTCAKCDQPILKGQPFTTAIVPGRLPNPGVVSGKVLVHKNEEDCKKR